MESLDQLRRMAVFAAVVDAGGFAAAGRSLGMTRAAVSKQIAALEDTLGVQLLVRTTRRVRPTTAGAAFHRRCAALAADAEAAWAEVREERGEPRGRLRVTASLGIGQALVAPRVASFLERYPDVALTLHLDDAVTDLVNSDFDVAIRTGRLEDSALRARRIGRVRLLVVAAPAYLAGRSIETPADLDAVDWVTFRPLGDPSRLAFTDPSGGTHRVTLRGRVSTNNGGVVRRLAVDGVGVTLLPEFFAREALADGRLVTVLDDYALPEAGVYAVHAHTRRASPSMRAFIDHLASRGSNSPSTSPAGSSGRTANTAV